MKPKEFNAKLEMFKVELIQRKENINRNKPHSEFWMIITPSENVFKVVPHNGHETKFFSSVDMADQYFKEVTTPEDPK